MSDLNSITLSGRLTSDPIVRGGGDVAVLPFASNRQYQSANAEGGWANETLFIDATAFGHAAKKCISKLVKGDSVTVTGRLELNEYEAQDGSKRRVHRIVVNQVESPALMTSRYDRKFGEAAQLTQETTFPGEPVEVTPPVDGEFVGVGIVDSEDDIPF